MASRRVTDPLIEVVSSVAERSVARAGNVFGKIETNADKREREAFALNQLDGIVPVPRLRLRHDDVLVTSAVTARLLATYGHETPFDDAV